MRLVECLVNPKIRYLPVAVCGDITRRHSITLAANAVAKQYGIESWNAHMRDDNSDIFYIKMPYSQDKIQPENSYV